MSECTLLAKGVDSDTAGLPADEEARQKITRADGILLGSLQWIVPDLCSITVVAAAPDQGLLPRTGFPINLLRRQRAALTASGGLYPYPIDGKRIIPFRRFEPYPIHLSIIIHDALSKSNSKKITILSDFGIFLNSCIKVCNFFSQTLIGERTLSLSLSQIIFSEGYP